MGGLNYDSPSKKKLFQILTSRAVQLRGKD